MTDSDIVDISLPSMFMESQLIQFRIAENKLEQLMDKVLDYVGQVSAGTKEPNVKDPVQIVGAGSVVDYDGRRAAHAGQM